MTDIVAPLSSFGAADVAAVGGKAANLGELLRAGLPVPPGFVVTTAAYIDIARQAGIDVLVTDPATAPASLRQAITDVEVPAAVRDAVTAAYARLGDDVPVAVRSSATAEDLPGAAFAGQQDTYLNVVGADAVVDAVRRCWASLWTDRAIAYRRERRIDPADVRIAVVVQRMVDADVAGVMFTADPASGARDRIVVDAGQGLGEAVVSGEVTPDHYELDDRGHRLSLQLRPDGTAPLLDAADLAALAEQARAIAGHFGRPQDIEWAIAQGRVWILQARPMTALPPPPQRLNRFQRLQAAILSELLPVRPYPMDVSTQVLRGPALLMAQMTHEYGIEGLFTGFLREEDGVAVQLVPGSPHLSLRALATPFRLIAKSRRFHPASWIDDPRQREFLARIDRLETLDLPALPWRELVAVPDRALSAQELCRDLRIDYLPGAGLAVLRLVVVLTLLRRRRLLADLLGGARTRTEDGTRALGRMAARLRAEPALRDRLTGLDAQAGWQLVAHDDDFARLRTDITAFLREFGRRETTSPMLISAPTLAESPDVALGMVLALAAVDAHPSPMSRSADALARLLAHPLLRSPRRAARVARAVAAAQDAVAFREDTHFFFTASLPTLRRAILETGRRMADAGVLERAADILHLRWEEVSHIADVDRVSAAQTAMLRGFVTRRAARRAVLAGVPLIDMASVFPASGRGDALVTGTPAGAGTATGVARVVHGAADFDRLQAGEVLVCPYTNPSWTPLFQRAAAVVVDTGSSASHAAIVAREYGLPAVMGTGNGTTAIADGERVRVDGTRGRVTRAQP
ncbi:PEP/pyruvate-binding domain-containing protein [Microbacterium luticocti]|uniref:PEP/pyruvate-binding domain-containing protein n=1 Tax=Microbacterium luticocti TaxID=451764 RepID=UPI0004289AC6|nr:PEP/pyruvate-binding domain-containing protein [Microbacterium luticocti]